jgi:hypothetical protein
MENGKLSLYTKCMDNNEDTLANDILKNDLIQVKTQLEQLQELLGDSSANEQTLEEIKKTIHPKKVETSE